MEPNESGVTFVGPNESGVTFVDLWSGPKTLLQWWQVKVSTVLPPGCARHLPGDACAGKEALCDLLSLQYFPTCQETCATPAPITRHSSILAPIAFLLRGCLCAPFSPSLFYPRISTFSFCLAPAFPSHPMLQPTIPPAFLQPCLPPPPPFLFLFSKERGHSGYPPADQGGGTGMKERRGRFRGQQDLVQHNRMLLLP